MNIREACDAVLGEDLSRSLIAGMGIQWAVVAATAECKVSHGPVVKATLKAWVAEQKRRTQHRAERDDG